MPKESNLEGLKEDYKKIQEENGLPNFDKMNEEFNIEKIAETETDFLMREIRKFMADKFMNYLRFVESFLNPVNSPMFVFSIVKSLGAEEKKKLTDVYKRLAKIEMDLVKLDLEFSEEEEADFIKKSYEVWQEIKKEMLIVIEVIKKNWDNKLESNEKNYFG